VTGALAAALAAGLVAGYGIAIPVGAVGMYLVALTARTSLRTGAGAAFGVASADGLYALTAVTGGAALARAIQPAADDLRWAAALVLTVLAARGAALAVRQYRRADLRPAAESRVRPEPEPRTRPGSECVSGSGTRPGPGPGPGTGLAALGPGRAYLTFLAITLMNPVTVIYFAALVVGRQATSVPGGVAPAGFVLAAFAASASWQLLLAGGGALLGRALAGRRAQLITALVASAIISALALHLLLAAARSA
jgi:arginine exporter protein ArgO